MHIKTGLLVFFGLSCLINSAYGDVSKGSMIARAESIKHGTAYTIGVSSDIKAIGYIGLSFNHITSSRPIQIDNRKDIYPLYLFAGLNAPWKISPYIEAGTDLIDEMFVRLDSSVDESKKRDEVDYYYAGGLRFLVTERIGVSLYTKKYAFKFRSDPAAPLIKSNQRGYGLEAWIYF
jgi:hypothetical protein